MYLAAGGRSEVSGLPLTKSFHADHILPFSAGGETDVMNGQALLPQENLTKADKYVILRDWQEEGVALWHKNRMKGLIIAVPGAGKTILGLSCALGFLEEFPHGKIIINVPTDNLRTQWQADAWKHFGLSLQTKEFTGTMKPVIDGTIHPDYHGAVVTFSLVGKDPLTFRSITSKQPTMVIYDEIHHLAEERSWGNGARTAFEGASAHLSLSGTPFRTDGKAIPFLEYTEDGTPLPLLHYTQRQGVSDGFIRVISFHHSAGTVRYLKNGVPVTGLVQQDVSDDEAKQHLGKLISGTGEYAKSLLGKAHEKLLEVRQNKLDAGALALCIDSAHALHVSHVLHDMTGEMPDLILSDDDKATSTVEKYKDSTRKWVVAVRKVSEGIDIKRLMVLCYLTNTVTDLFFRQAVGRISRHEGTEWDEEAYCFIPDDPRLVDMARKIIEEQILPLQEEDEIPGGPFDERTPSSIIMLGTSEADDRGIIIEGESFAKMHAEEIKALARFAQIPESKAALALEYWKSKNSGFTQDTSNDTSTPPTHTVTAPPEKLKNDARATIRLRVGRLARMKQVEHRDIHNEYRATCLGNRYIGPKDMSLAQYKEKVAWLEAEIAKAQMNSRATKPGVSL